MFHHLPSLAQPVMSILHQPNQNQVDGGTAEMKVNPTQLSERVDHPVPNNMKL